MKITFISDTHCKHPEIAPDLPGGDLIIHAGDFTSVGNVFEINQFAMWYNGLDNYTHKVYIAGNHDLGFEVAPDTVHLALQSYTNITYLQDSLVEIEGVKIYGSPWTPFFYNWAFNIPRDSDEIASKWNLIPEDADIVITHGPAYGFLDRVIGESQPLGCERLTPRLMNVKPKIHVCGHIHSGYGYKQFKGIHFINAAMLDESYQYTHKVLHVDWEHKTNLMEFYE